MKGKNYFIFGVLLPISIYYGIFFLYPFVNTFLLSFYRYDILTPKSPTGLSNYRRAIFDRVFLISLRNTIYYAMGVLSAVVVLGLGMSLALNSIKRFRSMFRLFYFIPVMTALVACAIVWKFLYQPAFGLFNMILENIGFPPQSWLHSSKTALLSVMLMGTWRETGLAIIIFVAGLQAIPKGIQEAARIDGAGKLQKFFRITLPLLRPTMAFVVLTTLLRGLQVFAPVYVMTKDSWLQGAGGPNHATEVTVLYVFKEGVQRLHAGYASAMSVILLILLMGISIICLKFSKTKWMY